MEQKPSPRSVALFRRFQMLQRGENLEYREHPTNAHMYNPVPSILPAGDQSFHEKVGSNPGVIVGMALTTLALMGMFRKSYIGDKAGAQKFMQYRISAQFLTIMAMAGVGLFGASYMYEDEGKK